MAAWMKSTNGQWYLTGEFTVTRVGADHGAASQISEVLGFNAAQADHAAVKAEVVRVETARAQLVKDITDRVLAGVSAGLTVTPDVDVSAIASAVEAQLADDFAGIPEAVVDEQAERLKS